MLRRNLSFHTYIVLEVMMNLVAGGPVANYARNAIAYNSLVVAENCDRSIDQSSVSLASISTRCSSGSVRLSPIESCLPSAAGLNRHDGTWKLPDSESLSQEQSEE